jgi:hypothetical protein
VLLFPFGVGEAQIDKLHVMLIQQRQYVFSGHRLILPDVVIFVVVHGAWNAASTGRVAVKKIKAKTVPTFKLPQKGVIMRSIVQKGCTMTSELHHYSAFRSVFKAL